MNQTEIDYFSFLPEALFIIIISFLPYKQAVANSVLSSRWRHLWQSTTNINLDQNLLIRNREDEQSVRNVNQNFILFIQNWMANFHGPNIQKFALLFSDPESHHVTVLNESIQFALHRREVKAIHLDFSDPSWDEENLEINPEPALQLPFFNAHKMLESIELSYCKFEIPQFNRFLALKCVSLSWIELRGSILNKFISMCPLLESLSLKRCWNIEDLVIESEKLIILVIDKCTGPGYISVDAPYLKFFKYCGLSVYMLIGYNKRSMEEGVFDFGLQDSFDEEDGQLLYNFLMEFWSVRVLTVCSYMFQVLPMADEQLSLDTKLENMRNLVLKTELHINEYYGITFFLNSCPYLEILTIDLSTRKIFEEYQPPFTFREHPFYSNFYSARCVGKNLKTLNVNGYKGTLNEELVLRYLLKYGKVLEYLFISLSKERGPNGMDTEPMYRTKL